jgi:transposase
LAQLKLMAAAAEPSGHLIASDVVAGQRADDPLYVPLIRRVREILGRTGLVYAGDSKMAALATRGHLVAHQDYYIVPLPMTGTTGQEFAGWVEPIVAGSQTATLIWDGGRLVGAGYEFERTQEVSLEGQCIGWTERVQVVRSPDLAQRQAKGLDKRLETAQTKLKALTPEPGRGKRQIRTESALQKAIDGVLEEHEVQGLLTVDWRREVEEHRRYVGPGRPGPQRAFETEESVRYVITAVLPNEAAIAARKQRLGWRAYATNVPAHQLSLSETVLHYRGGWCLERDFHLVKDLPLGLSPLFVWTDDQVKGLVRLLTLALRLLTLIESQVRRELAQAGASLTGLYEGQPRRATQRPSGKRLLKAFARANLTLTRVSLTSGIEWHITPLSPLHEQILSYLRLPMSLYTHLANP